MAREIFGSDYVHFSLKTKRHPSSVFHGAGTAPPDSAP
jgi:hypothetical protein